MTSSMKYEVYLVSLNLINSVDCMYTYMMIGEESAIIYIFKTDTNHTEEK